MQALNDPSRYSFMASKKTLEINPYHPIILELSKKIKDSGDDESIKELAWVLFDSSLVTAGFDIDDQVIVGIVKQLNPASLLTNSLFRPPSVPGCCGCSVRVLT